MKLQDSLGFKVRKDHLLVLDQTKLPTEEVWIRVTHPDEMGEIIKRLQIRGAPLIGVGAALALGLHAEKGATRSELESAGKRLVSSRPTAVNLRVGIERVLSANDPVDAAQKFFDEDVACCERIGSHGASLVESGDKILTHCNAGALATAGIGTAIGVIHKAHALGKKIHVFVDETRPLLQGARLTAWELERLGIPYTLLCDNAAASLMAAGKVSKVIVGADRIAANGDFANKVGTFGVALAARFANIPFYVAAPLTTVDLKTLCGRDIPIEDRGADEVRRIQGVATSPEGCAVYNPAFDLTYAELVTAFVLDSGIVRPSELKASRPPQNELRE